MSLTPFPTAKSQAGMGLVELMVGVTIALFASLAIFQTFAVSEEQRRTTSSGSEGLQGGTLAINQLKRVVQNAGYGMVTPTNKFMKAPARAVTMGALSTIVNANAMPQEFLTGCTTQGGLRVAPVIATSPGPGLASDTIVVMQGNSAIASIPAEVTITAPAGSIDVSVDSSYGFRVNDWILVYNQNAADNPGATRPVACTFARVIALPAAPVMAPGILRLSVATAAAYVQGQAQVANLGPNPQAIQISVVNNRLQAQDLAIAGGVPQILADNVLAMKVQLGIDVSNDDNIDEWINPPALAANWLNPPNPAISPAVDALPVAAGPRSLNQIKALRVGLLIRSPQFERANRTTNTCDITGAGPFSVLGAVAGDAAQRIPAMPSSGNYTLAGNQRCFRYNTVTGVIPLRNLIMSEL